MVKVLFVDAQDDPIRGPWVDREWDYVFDLGSAGRSAYETWSSVLGCPVGPLQKLASDDFETLRAFLLKGQGLVVDQYGLDWWDLISIEWYQQLERYAQLTNAAKSLGPRDEVFVSRHGPYSRILQLILGRSIPAFQRTPTWVETVQRRIDGLRDFTPAQILQILGDKYDPGYRIRRRFAERRKPAHANPVVLLPSAYINATRMQLEYARSLPDTDFLLVATRKSGWADTQPDNVGVAHLASYAPKDFVGSEFAKLVYAWRDLERSLAGERIFSSLIACGIQPQFADFLRQALMIRNAWAAVFDREPVCGVLSADDANFTTRIPILLANSRKLPALAVHHGALDGRYRMRPETDCLYLAKSQMEKDYLHEICGNTSSSVELGSPPRTTNAVSRSGRRRAMVFFSEGYEVLGGRTREIYRELLPQLAELAARTGHQFVVKLHPAEILRQRKSIAKSVLSKTRYLAMRFVQGPLTDELLNDTWCAVTIISTAAVDCTMRGIPVFVCPWLDYSNYGYAEQMLRFGAGVRLNCAAEIACIPKKITESVDTRTSALWSPISPENLRAMLTQKWSRCAQAAG